MYQKVKVRILRNFYRINAAFYDLSYKSHQRKIEECIFEKFSRNCDSSSFNTTYSFVGIVAGIIKNLPNIVR